MDISHIQYSHRSLQYPFQSPYKLVFCLMHCGKHQSTQQCHSSICTGQSYNLFMIVIKKILLRDRSLPLIIIDTNCSRHPRINATLPMWHYRLYMLGPKIASQSHFPVLSSTFSFSCCPQNIGHSAFFLLSMSMYLLISAMLPFPTENFSSPPVKGVTLFNESSQHFPRANSVLAYITATYIHDSSSFYIVR